MFGGTLSLSVRNADLEEIAFHDFFVVPVLSRMDYIPVQWKLVRWVTSGCFSVVDQLVRKKAS